MGTDERTVLLGIENKEVALAFDDIRRAKLMLTKELLAAHEQSASAESGKQ